MPNRLTRRELQCVRLAGENLSNKEIARRLGDMSPRTVGNHLSNAYAKLKTSDRLDAAMRAARDYPDLSRIAPIPMAPMEASRLLAPEPGGDPGERAELADPTWFLPRPPQSGLMRMLLIVGFAAFAAVFILGIAAVIWATISLTSSSTPENAMSSTSSRESRAP